MRKALLFAACLLTLAAALHGAGAGRQVTIGPAPVERAAQVVSLTLPRELAAGATLRDERGQIVPLQAESDLSAKFIVARQAAGQTLKFTLEPGRLPDQGNVQVVEVPSPPRPDNTPGIAAATSPSRIQEKTGRLRVSVGGRPILYYQMDRDAVPREDINPAVRRAGYLHPVFTPRGVAVTEDYPSEDLKQHGFAAPGPELLRNEADIQAKGFVTEFAVLEFGGIDTTWTGPVHGGFTSWHRWIDPKDPKADVLLNEAWEFTAYAVPKALGAINVFDLVITQAKAIPGPLYFDGHGLGLRSPAAWEEPERPALFSSPSGPGKQLRWLGFKGKTKDEAAGVAVLYPANGTDSFQQGPLSPTYLVATLPVIQELKPETATRAVFRHRVVTFDGPPDQALLEALWNGYTVPAVVTIAGP